MTRSVVCLVILTSAFLLSGIAKRLDIKVFVSRDKERVLKCFEDDEINRRITTDPTLTNLHVLPMNKLNPRVRVTSNFVKFQILMLFVCLIIGAKYFIMLSLVISLTEMNCRACMNI